MADTDTDRRIRRQCATDLSAHLRSDAATVVDVGLGPESGRARTPRSASLVALTLGAVLLLGCHEENDGRRAAPASQDSLAALARLPLVLERRRPQHEKRRLAALQTACAEMSRGRGGLDIIPESDAVARLRSADVILVADLHALDIVRHGFAKLVDELGRDDGEPRRSLAVGAEALPRTWQPLVRGICGGSTTLRSLSLRALMLHCWPWPVDHLATVLEDARQQGHQILGIGSLDELPVPLNPETKDFCRRPSSEKALTEVQGARLFRLVDESASRSIAEWLDGERGGSCQVVALCGLAHVADPDFGLPRLIRMRGYSVVVVVPFLTEVAEAQCVATGRIGGRWHELVPGVLYPPYIDASQVLDQVELLE